MELQRKVITVTGVETKQFDNGTQYKLKATDKRTYTFYDKKLDGGETQAFQKFKALEVVPGRSVTVVFKEETGDYQGKPYTRLKVAQFDEVSDDDAAAAMEKLNSPAPVGMKPVEVNNNYPMDRDKSILWQVAFKGAIERAKTDDEIPELTRNYYELLKRGPNEAEEASPF